MGTLSVWDRLSPGAPTQRDERAPAGATSTVSPPMPGLPPVEVPHPKGQTYAMVCISEENTWSVFPPQTRK